MKKIVCTLAAVLLAAAGLFAQEKPEKPWNIALKGGADYSHFENAFTYRENGQLAKQFSYQGGLAVGYDFTKRFGIRLDAIYGKNAGAGNSLETSDKGFYPYNFSSISAFLDALININPNGTVFHPKFYVGLGGAYSFGFSDMAHPSQVLPKQAGAFGVRLGFRVFREEQLVAAGLRRSLGNVDPVGGFVRIYPFADKTRVVFAVILGIALVITGAVHFGL